MVHYLLHFRLFFSSVSLVLKSCNVEFVFVVFDTWLTTFPISDVMDSSVCVLADLNSLVHPSGELVSAVTAII